jgi:hypothetical protein
LMRSSCLGLSEASTGTFSILSSVSRPSITCGLAQGPAGGVELESRVQCYKSGLTCKLISRIASVSRPSITCGFGKGAAVTV